MIYEVTSLGSRDSTLDTVPEAGSLFDQSQCGVLHQMLGIRTGMTGNLRKLRFLLRSEMYFHVPDITGFTRACQLRVHRLSYLSSA